jgi:hypothetical protein
MATPQSAGSTLAVHERTGRTTHDRDVRHVPEGLQAPHVPNAPRAEESTAPHADKTLPHHTDRPGDRTTGTRTHTA